MSTTAEAKEVGVIPPIFFEAVDPEAHKYDLGRPFWRDGYLYATDGRIVVRRRESLESLDPSLVNAAEFGSHGKTVNAGSVFVGDEADRHTDVREIPPDLVQHRVDVVEERFYGGRQRIETFEPNLRPVVMRDGFRKVLFATYYLAMLAKHGVRRLHLHPDKDHVQAYFKTDDFEGLLMPMAFEEPDA